MFGIGIPILWSSRSVSSPHIIHRSIVDPIDIYLVNATALQLLTRTAERTKPMVSATLLALVIRRNHVEGMALAVRSSNAPAPCFSTSTNALSQPQPHPPPQRPAQQHQAHQMHHPILIQSQRSALSKLIWSLLRRRHVRSSFDVVACYGVQAKLFLALRWRSGISVSSSLSGCRV